MLYEIPMVLWYLQFLQVIVIVERKILPLPPQDPLICEIASNTFQVLLSSPASLPFLHTTQKTKLRAHNNLKHHTHL